MSEWKYVPTFSPANSRVSLPFRQLPSNCPHCQRKFLWGWMEEELSTPLEECDGSEGIRILRIPRPDHTLFCPACEERILN